MERSEVGVVSDGKKLYMSAAEAGDEAFLLAKNLPNVPVLIGPERGGDHRPLCGRAFSGGSSDPGRWLPAFGSSSGILIFY